MSKTVPLQINQFSIAKTVLIQTIQFSISTQFKLFYFKIFSLALVCCFVLFNPLVGPNQVLRLWTWVDLKVMAMNSSIITRTLPSSCLVRHPGHSLGGGVYNLAEKNSRCILQTQPTRQLMNISFSSSAMTSVSISTSQLENITYEFLITSPAVSCLFSSLLVICEIVGCGHIFNSNDPAFVQNSTLHPCVAPFLVSTNRFVKVQMVQI